MKAWHVVVLIVVVGIYWWTRPPSGVKITREMVVDEEAGTVGYRGVVFTAEWGEPSVREGVVRYAIRAWEKSVPIVTHHLVLTTGEFSDPSIVSIDHNGGGSFIWRAQKQPTGTLVVLHVVPASESVFRSLRLIEKGDRVRIAGRDELRGSIEADTGAFLRLGHSNHVFVLAEQVGPGRNGR